MGRKMGIWERFKDWIGHRDLEDIRSEIERCWDFFYGKEAEEMEEWIGFYDYVFLRIYDVNP